MTKPFANEQGQYELDVTLRVKIDATTFPFEPTEEDLRHVVARLAKGYVIVEADVVE